MRGVRPATLGIRLNRAGSGVAGIGRVTGWAGLWVVRADCRT